MPNITFEYCGNLSLDNIEPVVISIHKILETELPTAIENCKTSMVKANDFIIGDNDKKAAFIRIQIYIMPGRSEKLLKDTSQKITNFLRDAYRDLYDQFDLQISVAIIGLPKSYCKISNGDL